MKRQDSSRHVCLDLGGTRLELGIIDDAANIETLKKYQLSDYESPEDWLSNFVEDHPESTEIPWVLGVPSPIRNGDSMTDAPNLFDEWSGDNFLRHLRDYEIQYYLENDANLTALGEYHFGNHEDVSSIGLLTLGTGLGCGLIIDGEKFDGSTGAGGELGHVPVEPNGRPCNCGNSGCLERYASATGLEISYKEQTGTERTAREIMERFDKHESARESAETTGTWIGRGAAILVNIVEPEKIILTGGLAQSLEKLLPSIRQQYQKDVFASGLESLPIQHSSIDNPALRGGSALLRNYIQ